PGPARAPGGVHPGDARGADESPGGRERGRHPKRPPGAHVRPRVRGADRDRAEEDAGDPGRLARAVRARRRAGPRPALQHGADGGGRARLPPGLRRRPRRRRARPRREPGRPLPRGGRLHPSRAQGRQARSLRAHGAQVLMPPAPESAGDVLETSDQRRAGATGAVTLTLRIRRYNPELRGEESWWDEFTIQADPNDRLLDALHQVKWDHDGTLALRRSCAHGICGSDAMMVNGKNRLACKVLVKDVAPKVTVEPIRGLPVLKDLYVDMEPFFNGYRSILPYLINDEGEPDAERLQSPEERHRFDDTTKC